METIKEDNLVLGKKSTSFAVNKQTMKDFKEKCSSEGFKMNFMLENLMKFYIENKEFRQRLALDDIQKKVMAVPLNLKLLETFRDECKREGLSMNSVVDRLMLFYTDNQVEIESKIYLK